jgi:hypothetical protein
MEVISSGDGKRVTQFANGNKPPRGLKFKKIFEFKKP